MQKRQFFEPWGRCFTNCSTPYEVRWTIFRFHSLEQVFRRRLGDLWVEINSVLMITTVNWPWQSPQWTDHDSHHRKLTMTVTTVNRPWQSPLNWPWQSAQLYLKWFRLFGGVPGSGLKGWVLCALFVHHHPPPRGFYSCFLSHSEVWCLFCCPNARSFWFWNSWDEDVKPEEQQIKTAVILCILFRLNVQVSGRGLVIDAHTQTASSTLPS